MKKGVELRSGGDLFGEVVEAIEDGHEEGLADEDGTVGLREVEVVGGLIERAVEFVASGEGMEDDRVFFELAGGVDFVSGIEGFVAIAEEGDGIHVDDVEVGKGVGDVVGDGVVDFGLFEGLGDIGAEGVGHFGDHGDAGDVLLEDEGHEEEAFDRAHGAGGSEDAKVELGGFGGEFGF